MVIVGIVLNVNVNYDCMYIKSLKAISTDWVLCNYFYNCFYYYLCFNGHVLGN